MRLVADTLSPWFRRALHSHMLQTTSRRTETAGPCLRIHSHVYGAVDDTLAALVAWAYQ